MRQAGLERMKYLYMGMSLSTLWDMADKQDIGYQIVSR